MPQHKWDDRKMALHCIYLSLTWFLLEEETMGAQGAQGAQGGGGGKHILRGAGVPPRHAPGAGHTRCGSGW